jgi:hypothetical protein
MSDFSVCDKDATPADGVTLNVATSADRAFCVISFTRPGSEPIRLNIPPDELFWLVSSLRAIQGELR